jgi:hypothetical protein
MLNKKMIGALQGMNAVLLPRIVSLLKEIALAFSLIAFGLSDLRSEELTGIVKQPTAPYGPAPDSTVTVYETDGKTKITPPDTTDGNGRYRFQIKKGKEVVVRATWRSEKSTPGLTKTKVEKDPTVADVQLLPPLDADFVDWLKVGQQAAEADGSAVVYTVGYLSKAGVPAASVYEFILGVRKEATVAFPHLNTVQIFNSEDSKAIALSLQKAEKQLTEEGSVPSKQDLAVKVGTQLTDRQHIEILAFIAPSENPNAYNRWKAAIEKASIGKFDKEEVLKKSSLIKAAAFEDTMTP